MGGDIGIAFVTTLIARRSQFHQSRLAGHTTAYDPGFMSLVARIARTLERAGTSSAEAARRALALVYRQTLAQATTLAYLDALWVLGILSAAMIPLLLLTRRPRSGAAPAVH
jgi:DHA2 family multidrug resistance protein